MSTLINQLIVKGYLQTPSIIHAFETIERKYFLSHEYYDDAPCNHPISIGHGQTNSQPLTVALMLEWLQAGTGENVLDVGSGSGWTTALLSYLVWEKGRVTAIERIKDLYQQGQVNISQCPCSTGENMSRIRWDGWEWCLSNSPYDKILVSAGADRVPQALIEQLALGGRLVIPVQDAIWVYNKNMQAEITTKKYDWFRFVPLLAWKV